MRTQNAPFADPARAARTASTARWCGSSSLDHWDTIEERFPRTLIPRMLEGITWLVDDASVADRAASILAAHPIPEGERVIAQHLERQRVHRALRRNASTIASPPRLARSSD